MRRLTVLILLLGCSSTLPVQPMALDQARNLTGTDGTVEALPCLEPGGWCGGQNHPWYQNGLPNVGNTGWMIDNSWIWTGCSAPAQFPFQNSLTIVGFPTAPWAPPSFVAQDCCRIRIAWPPIIIIGAERWTFPIPDEPGLRGQVVVAQAFCVDQPGTGLIHPHGAIKITIGF